MKLCTSLLLIFSFLITSAKKNHKITKADLGKLYNTMQGFYSSEKQSKEDSSYFDIRLKMVPIWTTMKNEYWLYVEQAMSSTEDKPYRQRIYELTLLNDTTISSKVYTIKGGEQYYGAWKNKNLLDKIVKDSLEVRVGCAIFLSKKKKKFSGSTNKSDCESSLRGASYATSEVDIAKKKLVSWDRGWDKENKQVWGAVKGGYKFIKMK